MSQTTLWRNFGGKEGGGRTFEGGILAGHYGITLSAPSMTTPTMVQVIVRACLPGLYPKYMK